MADGLDAATPHSAAVPDLESSPHVDDVPSLRSPEVKANGIVGTAGRQVTAVGRRRPSPNLLRIAEHVDQRPRPITRQPKVAAVKGVELKSNDGPHAHILSEPTSPRTALRCVVSE